MNNIWNLNDMTGSYNSLLQSGYEIAKNLTQSAKFLNMLSNAAPDAASGISPLPYGNAGLFHGIYGGGGLLPGSLYTAARQTAPGTQISGTEAISRDTMTMEEYKQYLHDQISRIPRHPSRALESISIQITEAGFEAMKHDPEYEAWVLDDLKTGWAQPDPWAGICGGAYAVIHYGATKEECNACSWFPGYQNGNGENLFREKSKNSFWERRTESQKLYQEQRQMAALEQYYRFHFFAQE